MRFCGCLGGDSAAFVLQTGDRCVDLHAFRAFGDQDVGDFTLIDGFEAGLAYQKNDLDKGKDATGEVKMNGDVSSTAFLASAYYDIPTGTKISPFIGGGVGLAKVRLNDVALEGDRDMLNTNDMVFAYHLSLGVSFAVNPQLNLDAGYRYAATEDLRFSSGGPWDKDVEITNASHNLFAGVRYAF